MLYFVKTKFAEFEMPQTTSQQVVYKVLQHSQLLHTPYLDTASEARTKHL